MAVSATDSMLGTGFGSAKQGARRTSSMFKRRTGSSFGQDKQNALSPTYGADASPLGIASPGLRDGPVQVITTPDGKEMAISPNGTLTPVQVIKTPEG